MSLAPALRGGPLDRDILSCHYHRYHPGGATPQSAIRSGNWRLVHFYEAGRSELYDLNSDPGETTDVAAREPLRTAMLQAKLDARREEVNAQLPTPNADHAPVRDGPKKGRSSR